MISIHRITNRAQIKDFFLDPTCLYNYGSEFVIKPTEIYLGVYKDAQLIGIDICREITKISVEMHLYLLPDERNKGLTTEISNKIKDYLLTNTLYRCIMAYCPSVCPHVIKYLTNTGFKPMGHFPNSVIYHNQLCGLIYYQYDMNDYLSEIE